MVQTGETDFGQTELRPFLFDGIGPNKLRPDRIRTSLLGPDRLGPIFVVGMSGSRVVCADWGALEGRGAGTNKQLL